MMSFLLACSFKDIIGLPYIHLKITGVFPVMYINCGKIHNDFPCFLIFGRK